MPPLRLDILRPETKDWRPIGQANHGDPYGSMSNNTDTDKEVIVFGFEERGDKVFIAKSRSGSYEANETTRTIHAIGKVSVIAILNPGEDHILEIQTDVSPEPRIIKFTHLAE